MEISTKGMIEFYEAFDAVDFKYQLFLYHEEKPCCDYDERYMKYHKHEYAHQFSELTKRNYGSVRANLDLVYAKQELTDSAIKIYDLVMQKLINQYINIDGIERMFSEKYADFEWDMHMGIDYNKHSMKFYRDHFIHQVRDAYMMHRLLSDAKFEQYIMKILANESNSKISRFVCKQLLQQLETNGCALTEGDKQSENLRDHYLRNIIYMSCYMAALFHDIGYPETTNIANRRRITDYISNIYNFENGYSDFNRISALLQNSLLFRVVTAEEIRNKIETSKPDHGVLSAIIFLMHFYENGVIHRLEPYKLCAVELAALAIYNHTAKYLHCDPELKKNEITYNKISFVLNPISYLLRISDDMQEWDRIYFEISNNSNLIVCSKCKTPIVRVKKNGVFYYRCNCNSIINNEKEEENGIFSTVFRYDAFPYRRIYNVTVCDGLSWKDDGNKIIFKLHYNLENLLHVAYINSNYAKQRIKELNQMKRLFDFQAIMPTTYVDYFVSANVILIKVRIIEKWIEKNKSELLEKWWVDFERKLAEGATVDVSFLDTQLLDFMGEFKISELYNIVDDESYNEYKEKVLRYMRAALDLYGKLCWFMYIYQKINSVVLDKNLLEAKNVINKLNKEFEESVKLNVFYSEDVKCLIHDALVQVRRLYEEIGSLDEYPNDYYEQFKEDKEYERALYFSCDAFTSTKNYKPINLKGGNMIQLDAFTDLFLFHNLLKTLYGVV